MKNRITVDLNEIARSARLFKALAALRITGKDFISFKIGIKEDAEYVGGLNLFGEHFGNYNQNIEMVAKLER
ncbi:MAG: hypothetical protein LBF63_10765 [Treponema sp.]|nr:hypothetical protein [Treponema sp.]